MSTYLCVVTLAIVVCHKYQYFWCSGNQTPEERAYFNQYLELLFKVKRAICSCVSIDEAQKIYFANGIELRLLCTLLSNVIMK